MSVPFEPVMTKEASPSSGISSLLSLVVAVALGLLGAFVLFPDHGSHLAASLVGTSPKAYWYMSRGSAFVALGLLWISMMLGLLITDKIARSWPGAPVAFAIHEFVSLLGLMFAVFHALILLGDHYINYQLAQILMPFGSVNYHPIWVGLGQIGLYLWATISASFYIRHLIGRKAWKFIHYASFLNFMIAVMHGLASGTDSTLPLAQALYWLLGGSILFLTVYRILAGSIASKPQALPVRSNAVQNQRE
jgi:predicted ferric reductase